MNTQSSQFILGFTLGVVYSVMGIDTWVVNITVIVSYGVFLSDIKGINRTEQKNPEIDLHKLAN